MKLCFVIFTIDQIKSTEIDNFNGDNFIDLNLFLRKYFNLKNCKFNDGAITFTIELAKL